MPIPTSLVGLAMDPVEHDVDERWTMAYAAALADHSPEHMDTTRASGVVAHPLFPVCVEWPAIVASRNLSLEHGVSFDEMQRSVHAWHDLRIDRPIRPGDRLTTQLNIVGVESKRPGAMMTLRLLTLDASGQPVATTTQGGINLGVAVSGAESPDPDPPPALAVERIGTPDSSIVDIPAGLAHTYTECARIWNPIHTDRAVAMASGLPDIILHGTASMALGVSEVVKHRAGGDPTLVRRIIGRFGAMVLLPSTVTVNIWPSVDVDGDSVVPYEVVNRDGNAAVSAGAIVLGAGR